jgi:hypothetical protein
MKTPKYYRLDEKVGGMRGGAKSKPPKIKPSSEPGTIKKKFKKWGHSISSKFSKKFQKSGVNMKNSNNSSMTPKQILENKNRKWYQTKSARYRQAQEAAMGLSTKDQKRANKFIQIINANKPLSQYTRNKRANQALVIAKTLGVNTKDLNLTKNHMTNADYDKLQTNISSKLEEKKKTYAEETFHELNKTKERQTSLSTTKKNLNNSQQKSAETIKSYTDQKEIINLLEKLEKTPGNKSIQNKLMKLDPAAFKNPQNNFKQIKKLTNEITNRKTQLKTKKTERNQAFKEETEATKKFKKQDKIFANHTKKKGTTNTLMKTSNNKTVGKRIGKAAAITGIVALGTAATVAAPLPMALLAGEAGIAAASIAAEEKFTKKSTFLKQLNSNKNMPGVKERARRIIIERTNSPEARYKMDKAISKGKSLIEALTNKNNLLKGNYENFKTSLDGKYTRKDRNILKDYYKANRMKQIREGTRDNVKTEGIQTTDTTATPATPFKKQSTEQIKAQYTKSLVNRLPKDNNDSITRVEPENYPKFEPLLGIPNFNSLSNEQQNLFNSSINFNDMKTALKKQLKNEYTDLQNKNNKNKNENENERFIELKRLNELYKLGLNTPPPQLGEKSDYSDLLK